MTRAEFNIFFEKHYENYCRYAFTIIRDKDEVEDIVQSVMVDVWNSGKIHETEKPEHYVLRSIKFKCIDYQRKAIVKRKHEAEVIHISVAHEEEEENNEEYLISLMQDAIEKLPEKTQQVFKMAKQDGKSYKQIAEELDISPKTVENQMTRAFKHLREALGKYKHLYGFLIFLTFG